MEGTLLFPFTFAGIISYIPSLVLATYISFGLRERRKMSTCFQFRQLISSAFSFPQLLFGFIQLLSIMRLTVRVYWKEHNESLGRRPVNTLQLNCERLLCRRRKTSNKEQCMSHQERLSAIFVSLHATPEVNSYPPGFIVQG